MSHSTDDSRPAAGKPTLETLLRLKRAERPDAAFWEEFDRGLRQKQLAAIIEPKPWWLGLALLGRRLTPVGLPVSAAAAALFAVLVVRTQAPFASAPSSAPVEFGPTIVQTTRSTDAALETIPAVEAAPATAPRAERTPELGSALASSASSQAAPSASASVPVPALAAASSADSRSQGTNLPVVAALLELSPPVAARPTPSELTIAQNLAAVRAEAPELLADATRIEPGSDRAVALADDAVIDPAALKMEVRNPRHARVLLAMAENTAVESVGGISHLRDRMARSLDHDDALSGSSSRLGVGGDRLSLSF